MRIMYPFKVNNALAQMGVRPDIFESVWRSGMQQIGYDAGCTPQETAVAIIGHGLGEKFPLSAERVISLWINSGKIKTNRPEIAEALEKMGFKID